LVCAHLLIWEFLPLSLLNVKKRVCLFENKYFEFSGIYAIIVGYTSCIVHPFPAITILESLLFAQLLRFTSLWNPHFIAFIISPESPEMHLVSGW